MKWFRREHKGSRELRFIKPLSLNAVKTEINSSHVKDFFETIYDIADNPRAVHTAFALEAHAEFQEERRDRSGTMDRADEIE